MKKLFALLSLVFLTACGARTVGNFDTFASCLTEKGVIMYGSDTCPHCQQQKKLFEGSFDLVSYVECRKQPGKCEEAGISGYPTWLLGEKKLVGTQSLSALSEASACPL